MGSFSKENYKRITVDLAAMRKLSARLRSDGDKYLSLINRMEDSIRKLGYDWEDDNYARFLLYYLDRDERVRPYDEFVPDQADWLDKAIPIYESLPGDITSKVAAVLDEVAL